MEEIKIFENTEFGKVRTISIGGEPWLVGKDVAEILGYTNTRDALARHVDDDDKRREDSVVIHDAIGREQTPVLINESGLYSLILSSKLPSAKRFKHWVTSEVLPSVRKHGTYMTPETIEKTLSDPDFIIRLATELKEEKALRNRLQDKVEQDRPKVLFADAVSASHNSILIGELAKLLKQNGIETGQRRLFAQLRDEGFLIKGGSSKNLPTQRAMEMGLFEIKESAVSNPDGSIRVTKTTKVTGKGQQYFINRYLGRQNG